MMKNLACFGKKPSHLCSYTFIKLAYLSKSTCFLVVNFYHFVVLRVNPFWARLFYFISISFLGFWILMGLKPRTDPVFRPSNLDLFFTSVSASTASSMSTVEMEVFSNTQLVVLTVLMFIGGEVFTSMVGLHLRMPNLKKLVKQDIKFGVFDSALSSSSPTSFLAQIELGLVKAPDSSDSVNPISDNEVHIQIDQSLDSKYLKYNSVKFLGLVVFGYLLIFHVLGVTLVSLYLTLVSSASEVIKNKGLQMFTFCVFTTVSTFANSGLLLILIPQILSGNTLFPYCLRFSIWFLGKYFKKEESNYLLKNTEAIGYHHLLPTVYSSLLVVTVLAFIVVQFILFSSLEWNNSQALTDLNSYQKVVGVVFQCLNSRHNGETILDLSIISPAILVLFVMMMYLPPYTTFLPIKDDERCPQICERRKKGRGKIVENLILSQLSYLVIFIIIICITERRKMTEDPLNFNVFNIVVEVISAYGNVGFTTGYSCKRHLNPDGNCKDKWYGFSGKWSDEGKVILIMVMLFGRLKKHNMKGGRPWKLL